MDVLGTLNTDVVIRRVKDTVVLMEKPMNSLYREGRQLVTENNFKSALNGVLADYVRGFSRDPDVLDALQGKKVSGGK